MAEIVERGWSEVLKITRAPNLIQSDLCYLDLDGRQVGTVYAFAGCYDRIREALEEREATPEEAYLLEEQGREIMTLVKRLVNAELLIEKLKEEVGHWEYDFSMFDRAHEKAIDLWRKEHPDAGHTPDMSDLNEWMVWRAERAEAVKESLKASLMEISGFSAYWKCLRGNEEAWENVWNIATDALISLRTAEESSVVGLIDSTPAKHSPNAVNADGDVNSVIDGEVEE